MADNSVSHQSGAEQRNRSRKKMKYNKSCVRFRSWRINTREIVGAAGGWCRIRCLDAWHLSFILSHNLCATIRNNFLFVCVCRLALTLKHVCNDGVLCVCVCVCWLFTRSALYELVVVCRHRRQSTGFCSSGSSISHLNNNNRLLLLLLQCRWYETVKRTLIVARFGHAYPCDGLPWNVDSFFPLFRLTWWLQHSIFNLISIFY